MALSKKSPYGKIDSVVLVSTSALSKKVVDGKTFYCFDETKRYSISEAEFNARKQALDNEKTVEQARDSAAVIAKIDATLGEMTTAEGV